MITYELFPLDTLFFRGNTPMEAGLISSESLFPPPVSVVVGAFRTELMKQQNIPLNRQNGEKIAVSVKAILVRKQNRIYAPAPATWYVEKTGEDDHYIGMNVIQAVPISTMHSPGNPLGIQCSEGDIPFVVEKAGTTAKSLGNTWVDITLLNRDSVVLKKGDLLLPGDIYRFENRTGIELDSTRVVKKGQLYSANHIRLLDDVSLLVCMDQIPEYEEKVMSEKGHIQLGGERRLCRYQKAEDLQLPASEGKQMTFVPIQADSDSLDRLIASGKLKVTSGWDLATGFHKNTTSWIPAGAILKLN